MYGSIFAVCGAAMALSIAAITGARTQPAAQPKVPILSDIPIANANFKADQEQDKARRLTVTYERQPTSADLANLKFDARFENVAARDVLEFTGKAINKPMQINWPSLAEAGIMPETSITFKAMQTGIDGIFRALNEQNGVGPGRADWRFSNGFIEVASEQTFDRRETRLSIYDLSQIIRMRTDTYHEERSKTVEEVIGLIREFVYSDGWRDNGGTAARMTVVGDRMFIEAPERYHRQIRWMLDQLPGGAIHAAASAEAMKTFALKHVQSDEVVGLVRDVFGPQFLARVQLVPDARTNSITLSGDDEALRSVGAFIARIDVDVESRGPAVVKMYHLSVMRPEQTAAILGKFFSVAQRFQGDGRSIQTDPVNNSIVMRASREQTDAATELLTLLDQGATLITGPGAAAKREYTLKTVKPTSIRTVLSEMFNESPPLAQCPVTRSLECDDDTGRFTLVATPGQIEIVDKVIALIDRPM